MKRTCAEPLTSGRLYPSVCLLKTAEETIQEAKCPKNRVSFDIVCRFVESPSDIAR